MAHPELRAEQAHVDHAYERLEAMRAAVTSMLQEAFGERGGTFQSFTERDIRVRNSLTRLEHLQIGREALVFGRIDQAPHGENGSESFHIGRLAISDSDQEPLVVDWRAPVAEPFYRATGAHPMGLHRRRHFLTEGRTVIDLEDEYFDMGDSGDGVGLGLSGSQVLLAALDRSRTGRMRDIVATVQREQDEIIRGPLPGVLVVQGGPGTGKTAVALHRAAYLLYTHRFPLEGQGVLVVGPNPTFLRYIEHVLPSLGESGVELSTITGLLGSTRPTGRDDRRTARLKGDARMARLLARAVSDRERPLRRTVEIPYGGTLLRLTVEASAQIVAGAKRRPGTHNSRRRLVEVLLWRHLEAVAGQRSDEAGPAAAELREALRRVPDVAQALDRMWPLLTPEELLHDLFGARPLMELAGRSVLDPEEREMLFRPRSASVSDVAWTVADVALLDEAKALLGPVKRRAEEAEGIRSYGHIVVDEAQDLTPMQLRMLARRSIGGSMTVVGDLAQATGPWAPSGWAEVVGHLPTGPGAGVPQGPGAGAPRGWRRVELTVNYRTPSEIVELAARVLKAAVPGTQPPEAVRVTGEPVRILRAGEDLCDRASEAAAEELQVVRTRDGGDGSVAVIAPASLVGPLAAALGRRGVEYGLVGGAALDAPVTLIAVEDSKGLEFDAVVVVEPARIVRESSGGLRSLYVALTRATRRAAVVHGEPLPSSLQPKLGAAS